MVTLTETQFNPSLLDPTYNLLRNLFKSDAYFVQYSNNENELLGARQQGGVFLAIKGDLCKIISLPGCNDSGLGRWN